MIRIVMIYKPCMSAVMYECRFMLWANSSILDYYVSLIFRSALKVYIFFGGEKKKRFGYMEFILMVRTLIC